MKVDKKKKEDILIKNDKLTELNKYLKGEFIGIDDIIDNVVDSMRPFYLFPEYVTKPIVINLWGMTGTGKTTLIEKIVNFLELNKTFIKFDMGKNTNDDFITSFNKNTGDNLSNDAIIVLDEFQLGRTLDEKANEKDNTSRYIWDLVDSGKIVYGRNRHLKEVQSIIKKVRKFIKEGVTVDNEGYVNKNEDILLGTFSYSMRREDFEFGNKSRNTYIYINNDEDKDVYGRMCFILQHQFEKLVACNPHYFNYDDSSENRQKFFSKPMDVILKTLDECFEKTHQIMQSDYSKSLIFCLGNLDEIYYMSHNTNPDMDADMFHEDSLKINITHVKKALSQRFRVEQISRLGNNHFIYPAFSRKSYEAFIAKYLENKQKILLENYNLIVNFDASVNDIIYKEGIFPAQGIRPLFSTLNNYIDNNLSKIITDLIIKCKNIKSIYWSFDKETKSFVIKCNKTVLTYKIDTKLEDLRVIDNIQKQALVSVHESGHALVSSLVLGIAPDEVLSKTASDAEGYCLFKFGDNPQTKEFLLKRIMVLLGGSEAEKLIFGDENFTVGSSSDISKATDIAFNIVKRYGMNNVSVNISATVDESMFSRYVKDDRYEKDVLEIITNAQAKTRKLLSDNKHHLLLLSDVLTKTPKIFKDDVKKVFKDLDIKWNDEGLAYDFHKELETQLNTEKLKNAIKDIVL